ncbi:hypothetical protein [Amycolatopsis minnesotensis]|uniref:Uncharacterized protein n=1 Tax=Amycolatopsis minnesotensis TaxID=337894 RepID=A0ABN2PZ28_9PSEU
MRSIDGLAAATDREPDDPDVLLFSAILMGVRHDVRAHMAAGRTISRSTL